MFLYITQLSDTIEVHGDAGKTLGTLPWPAADEDL